MNYVHKMKKAEWARLAMMNHYVFTNDTTDYKLGNFSYYNKQVGFDKSQEITVFFKNRALFKVYHSYNNIERGALIMVNDQLANERILGYIRSIVDEMVRFSSACEKINKALEKEEAQNLNILTISLIKVPVELSEREMALLYAVRHEIFGDDLGPHNSARMSVTVSELSPNPVMIQRNLQEAHLDNIPVDKQAEAKAWLEIKVKEAEEAFNKKCPVNEILAAIPEIDVIDICPDGIGKLLTDNFKTQIEAQISDNLSLKGTAKNGQIFWGDTPIINYASYHGKFSLRPVELMNAMTSKDMNLLFSKSDELEFMCKAAICEACGKDIADFRVMSVEEINKELEQLDLDYL